MSYYVAIEKSNYIVSQVKPNDADIVYAEISDIIFNKIMNGEFFLDKYKIENNQLVLKKHKIISTEDVNYCEYTKIKNENFNLELSNKYNIIIVPLYSKKYLMIYRYYSNDDLEKQYKLYLKIDEEEYKVDLKNIEDEGLLVKCSNLNYYSTIKYKFINNDIVLCKNMDVKIKQNAENVIGRLYFTVENGYFIIPEKYHGGIAYLVDNDDNDIILDYFLYSDRIEVPKDGSIILNGFKIFPKI